MQLGQPFLTVALQQERPMETYAHMFVCCRYKASNGKERIRGNPKALKASQEYPPAFGKAVQRLWACHRGELQAGTHSKPAGEKACLSHRYVHNGMSLLQVLLVGILCLT